MKGRKVSGMNKLSALPRAVRWVNRSLQLLDQRKLPFEERIITCTEIEDVFDAIETLSVRGAPAIGIAAAYGLLVGLFDSEQDLSELKETINTRSDYLISARPTAVNLAWAVNRVRALCSGNFSSATDLMARLEEEAIAIHQEDISACHLIGDHGAALVAQHLKILTHCNAGSLAVSEMGTALAPIYRAYEQGASVHVFVGETRPLLQGARLTAYELQSVGVHCTLITDSMAAHMMSIGEINMVIVGADRVAANGDVANKIGTLNLAILCRYFGLPFYVACPVSTIDLDTTTGKEIEIEQRNPAEVTRLGGHQIAPENIDVANPAFDVTPASLVTGIITENGIVSMPYAENLVKITGGQIL